MPCHRGVDNLPDPSSVIMPVGWHFTQTSAAPVTVVYLIRGNSVAAPSAPSSAALGSALILGGDVNDARARHSSHEIAPNSQPPFSYPQPPQPAFAPTEAWPGPALPTPHPQLHVLGAPIPPEMSYRHVQRLQPHVRLNRKLRYKPFSPPPRLHRAMAVQLNRAYGHVCEPATTPNMGVMKIVIGETEVVVRSRGARPTAVTVGDVLVAFELTVLDIETKIHENDPYNTHPTIDSEGGNENICACLRAGTSLDFLRSVYGAAGLVQSGEQPDRWILQVG